MDIPESNNNRSDTQPDAGAFKAPPRETSSRRHNNFVISTNRFIEHRLIWSVSLVLFFLLLVVPKRFLSFRRLLDKSSKSTALKNTFMLLMINGFLGAFGIATQILITNTLGPTSFGDYAFYMALGTYGACIVRFGRDRTMIRDIVQRPEKFEDTVGGTVILGLILTLLFSVGMFICGVISGMEMPLALWLVIISCILVSFDLQPVYDSWRQMGLHAVYFLFRRFFECLPLWIIVLVCPFFFNITVIALLSTFASLLILVLQYREIISLTKLRIFTKDNLRACYHQFFENFEIALGTFLLLFLGPTIRIFLKNSWDSSEVGIFSATIQILIIVNFLFSQISRIGKPAMARVTMPGVGQREKQKAVFQYVIVMLTACLPLALPMILFPKQIVALVFIPEYSTVAIILPTLGIYKIVAAIGAALSQYVQSARHDRLYLVGVAAGAALSVFFGLTIIPKYGAYGAAWALLLSHGLSIFLYFCITVYSLFLQKPAADT